MKKNFFSMIELLVGMAVLTIMMVFLIGAFTAAEGVASNGNKSMNVFEKSNMTLDFMSGEISHLVVYDSPRTAIPMQHNDSSITFVARLPFGDNPHFRHKIIYSYSSGTLTRTIHDWDSANNEFFPTAASSYILIDDIDSFKFTCYNHDNTLRAVDTDYKSLPSYCQITMKLNNPALDSQNFQRSFTRRIYFK